jgi:Zn finger protein HypA/HybF involved in hydrogenase expression
MKNRFSREEYENAISSSFSIAEVCRTLGIRSNGGNYNTIHNVIKKYDIDISHFTGQGWNAGLKFKPKPAIPIEEVLVENSYYQSYKLKQRLFKEGLKEMKCECCGLTEWLGKPIALELHHINGINTDNRLENIAILCPNCHAQTDNYRGLNKSAIKETL